MTDAERRPLATQWFGLVFAPAVLLVSIEAGYLLVPWSCMNGTRLWLRVAGGIAVLLVALGALTAWRVWRRAGGGPPGEGPGLMPRERFMGVMGLAVSAITLIVVLAQWIGTFVVPACE